MLANKDGYKATSRPRRTSRSREQERGRNESGFRAVFGVLISPFSPLYPDETRSTAWKGKSGTNDTVKGGVKEVQGQWRLMWVESVGH